MKNRNKLLFASFILGLTFFSCRTLPPVKPVGSSAAAVVATAGPQKALFGRQTAQTLYFIKADKKKDLIGLPIVTSTYFVKDRVYLLNADPGEYVIVGYHIQVINQNRTFDYYYFFDQPSAEKTRFTVKSGQLNVFGDILSRVVSIAGDPDPLQNYTINIVAPGTQGWAGLGKAIFSGHMSYPTEILSVDTSAEKQTEMKTGVAEDFKETEWASVAK